MYEVVKSIETLRSVKCERENLGFMDFRLYGLYGLVCIHYCIQTLIKFYELLTISQEYAIFVYTIVYKL